MFSIGHNTCVKLWRNQKRSTKKKIFEKINVTIALNALYAKKRENISFLCFKKKALNREKQVILLMIWKGDKRIAKSEG